MGAARRLAVLVAAISLAVPAWAQLPRLAVMDFRAGGGITSEQAGTLTGILRTALHETGGFTLINREDMEAIARNHQIELVFCDDDACLLEVGSLLGAQKLVAGEIGLVLGEFVVNARLVDIAGDALANERVATQRSQPSAGALEDAMGELAAKLAGRPAQPRRDSGGRKQGPKYDGTIYAIEGSRILINRGREDGVRRGTLYDVYPPIGDARGDSVANREPGSGRSRLGRIEVREVRASHSIARWRGAPPSDERMASCPIRKFRLPTRLLIEPCFEIMVSQTKASISFAESVYSGGELVRAVQHKIRVKVEGPSFGLAFFFTPGRRIALGLRVDGVADNSVWDNYDVTYGDVWPPGSEPQHPDEQIYLVRAVIRWRIHSTRKIDFDLETDAGRFIWDLGLLEGPGTRPPWGMSDLRLRLRYHILDHWSVCLSQGFCASLGGDWQVTALPFGVSAAFGF